MRIKCTDNVYKKNNILLEEEEELQERLKKFYHTKNILLLEIEKEKKDDPSVEIYTIEMEVNDCDPINKMKASEAKYLSIKPKDCKETEPNETPVIICKYNSKGFCKRGQLCRYFHSNVDCKDFTETGSCSKLACTNRHREDCYFYMSRRGCSRSSNCGFLHKDKGREGEVSKRLPDINTGYVDNIKELEQLIKDMRKDLEQKDLDIESKKDKIRKLQKEVKDREDEIEDKNKIIRTLKEGKYSDSDNDYDEEEGSDEDSEEEEDTRQDHRLQIGKGFFGKIFEPREGMEKEADVLRKEWKESM